MYLHHSLIHLTWRVLLPNVVIMCSTSCTNRITVLISINFYRMEVQISFIHSCFTCRTLCYLKTIHSMNLGIKYWTFSDVDCMNKNDFSTTAVRVDSTSTSTIKDQIFNNVSNKFGFCSSYSDIQIYERSAAFHQGTGVRGTVSLDTSCQ